MVTGTHPDDIDLFDYVEGDLPAGRRDTLEVHLASCAACAEHVARVRAGREALREAQFLQLPPRRREAIFQNLPERRAQTRSSPALAPKRLLAVLVAIAAVVATVAALVNTGSPGSSGSEEGAAAGTGTGGSGAEVAPTKDQVSPLSATGSAQAIADELRQKGFDALVVGNHVEVHDATRAEVRRALEGYRTVTAQEGKKHVRIVIVR
jgi:anti-sigma factor RsiW